MDVSSICLEGGDVYTCAILLYFVYFLVLCGVLVFAADPGSWVLRTREPTCQISPARPSELWPQARRAIRRGAPPARAPPAQSHPACESRGNVRNYFSCDVYTPCGWPEIGADFFLITKLGRVDPVTNGRAWALGRRSGALSIARVVAREEARDALQTRRGSIRIGAAAPRLHHDERTRGGF